jgi:hypothetical protein
MEKITRAMIFLWYLIGTNTWAFCPTPPIEILLKDTEGLLLEGSLMKAQGSLFALEQDIQCRRWLPQQMKMFLFLQGVYHHLHRQPTQAQKYFQQTDPSLHPLFGDSVQKYAQYFQQPIERSTLKISHSRFQKLWIDGVHTKERTYKLTNGMHLIQLFSKDEIPMYAQWLYIESRKTESIVLPRKPPEWLLYLSGSQLLLGGFSFWMREMEHKKMEVAENEDTYQKAQHAAQRWSQTSITFSIVGTILFGVHFGW